MTRCSDVHVVCCARLEGYFFLEVSVHKKTCQYKVMYCLTTISQFFLVDKYVMWKVIQYVFFLYCSRVYTAVCACIVYYSPPIRRNREGILFWRRPSVRPSFRPSEFRFWAISQQQLTTCQWNIVKTFNAKRRCACLWHGLVRPFNT